MEIVEIDVLDGQGKITAAVSGYVEATRLRNYVAEANVAFANAEGTGLQLWENHDERSLRLLREHKEYFK